MIGSQLQGSTYEDFMPYETLKTKIQAKIHTLDVRCQMQEEALYEAIGRQDNREIQEKQAQYSETSGRFIELVDFVSLLQKEGVL